MRSNVLASLSQARSLINSFRKLIPIRTASSRLMSGGMTNPSSTCLRSKLIHCRDFLLFIPADVPGLNAVLSYYSSTVKVNSEGDVVVSDETVQSLGMRSLSVSLQCVHGALMHVKWPLS